MQKSDESLNAEFFEQMYEKNPDPWNFENSPYEKAKYETTLAAIPGNNYQSVFEIGCANGMLSEMLLEKCRHLLAVDASEIAVGNARKRLASYSHVEVEAMTIPQDFPDQKFDLILFSEIGYFLNKADLLLTFGKITAALLPGGHLLMVHWTPVVEEFPLTGDQVHDLFFEKATQTGLMKHLWGKIDEQYRMDLFEKHA